MWVEMWREGGGHGGTGWGFGECLWSPARKENGSRWPYWDHLKNVKAGDLVFHLRGKLKPIFVGYSFAATDGHETSERPPDPGDDWSYANAFHRVKLREYTAFTDPVPLREIFAANKPAFERYYRANKTLPKGQRQYIFFTIQAGRLQCQNGAYCSYMSEELAGMVFGSDFSGRGRRSVAVSVQTGEQFRLVRSRIGQDSFSENVRANYGGRCCFPECEVAEESFLIGAHIARWADSPQRRGMTANGLCFCLMHDQAFEHGFFSLAEDLSILVSASKAGASAWARRNLIPYHGKKIRLGVVLPDVDALREHRARIGLP